MEILFCSSVYNMNDYGRLCQSSKVPLSLADHNLNYNIISGLDATQKSAVSLINNVQIPTYPVYPKMIFRKQMWSHAGGAKDQNCGFLNLPFVKHVSRFYTTFSALDEGIKKAGEKEVYVLTYDLHWGISKAVRKAKRKYPQIHICAILPDIPGEMLAASNSGNTRYTDKLRASFKMRFIQMFDSYVFLTEHMKNVVNISQKPYVVVEGIYNDQLPPLNPRKNKKNIIFYSGQLNPVYGLNNLLDAFIEIYREHKDYELWLCGSGSLEEKIRSLKQECPAIKYYGYVNSDMIRNLQAEASVLVNPRQNIGEFTKYSFPSKTMEYLASGRPVVGYHLDGIPQEYDPYIQYVDGSTVADLRDKLLEICSWSEERREEIGTKSREFIVTKKNPEKQAKRIIDMFQRICTSVG